MQLLLLDDEVERAERVFESTGKKINLYSASDLL